MAALGTAYRGPGRVCRNGRLIPLLSGKVFQQKRKLGGHEAKRGAFSCRASSYRWSPKRKLEPYVQTELLAHGSRLDSTRTEAVSHL